MLSQILGIRDFDDLIKRIFDDRVGETGGDIGNLGAFFLRLFHVGIHKNCTARTKIYRILGVKSSLGKIGHGIIQGLAKVSMKEPHPEEQASLS